MLCHLKNQFKLWFVIVSWISMNEVRVVLVHNSKSKKDNLNVYIYCCHYHAEVRKKMCHQKGRTNKKNRTSRRLNMYYLYWYKYVCAKTRLINTFKKMDKELGIEPETFCLNNGQMRGSNQAGDCFLRKWKNSLVCLSYSNFV